MRRACAVAAIASFGNGASWRVRPIRVPDWAWGKHLLWGKRWLYSAF